MVQAKSIKALMSRMDQIIVRISEEREGNEEEEKGKVESEDRPAVGIIQPMVAF